MYGGNYKKVTLNAQTVRKHISMFLNIKFDSICYFFPEQIKYSPFGLHNREMSCGPERPERLHILLLCK